MAGGSLNVKHLWIQGGSGDPANVSEGSSPEYKGQLGKIGTIKASAGQAPRILQFVSRKSTDTTVAAAAYKVAYWSDQDDFEVVADQGLALGGSTAPVPAGVFLGTNPQAGSYGFIQVAGTWPVTLNGVTTADLLAGNRVYVAAADSDGLVSYMTGTDATTRDADVVILRQAQVGVALEDQADSSGTAAVLLTIPRNGW